MAKRSAHDRLVAVTVVAATSLVLTGCQRDNASVAADGHAQTSTEIHFKSHLTPCTVDQQPAPAGGSKKALSPAPSSSVAPEDAAPPEIADDPSVHRFCADVEVGTAGDAHVVRVGVLSNRTEKPLAGRQPLIYHPGGPGLDTIQILFNDPPLVDLDRYTVIAWNGDTSGSTPGACGQISLGFGHARVVTPPVMASIVNECGLHTAALRGAAVAAAELDGILDALKLARVDLLTHSYGTAIAEVYLDLHPDRVRRAVLDGPVALEVPWRERRASVASAIKATARRLLQTCADAKCGPKRVADYSQLRDSIAARRAVVGTSALTVTATDVDQATLTALRSRTNWAGWRQAVREALAGDGANLYRMSERYWVGLDRSAYWSALCGDIDHPRDLAGYRTDEPLSDAYLSELSPCLGTRAARPPTRHRAATTPQVVVLASALDVLTPASLLRHAPNLNASTETCLTHVVGHTSYGDARIRALVTRFLAQKASAAGTARACANPR